MSFRCNKDVCDTGVKVMLQLIYISCSFGCTSLFYFLVVRDGEDKGWVDVEIEVTLLAAMWALVIAFGAFEVFSIA